MKIKKLCASLAVVAAGFGFAQPAQAALQAAPKKCGGNLVCLYAHADYGGFLGSRRAGLGLMNISPKANDKMSSWINRTTRNASWFEHTNGKGKCYTMRQNSINNFVGWPPNDTASSWRTNRGC